MLHVWIIFLHYVNNFHIQGEMYLHIPYIWSVWVRENSTWIIGQLVNHGYHPLTMPGLILQAPGTLFQPACVFSESHLEGPILTSLLPAIEAFQTFARETQSFCDVFKEHCAKSWLIWLQEIRLTC